jgi:hypothetical protein
MKYDKNGRKNLPIYIYKEKATKSAQQIFSVTHCYYKEQGQ